MLIIFGFISNILATIWRGFVLTKLWMWFVATTFEVPQINIPQAIGISLIMGFLTYQTLPPAKNDKHQKEHLLATLISAWVIPTVSLMIGWIVAFWL